MSKTNQRYAIVDVETTGGRAARSRITEIGIVIFDGEKIVETYETLVNPETYIPAGITRLTGIDEEMVKDAPKFFEVAKRVVELTEGAIFVAHNVAFDYSFFREEFKRLGYTYSRRRLCTVRLSKKAFPGLPSYSLGNLIKHFDFTVSARHRALADALATTELLKMSLQQQGSEEEVKLMVNMGIKESRLPKNLSIDRIQQLPEDCGVYYFYNQAGEVVYVGKSTNIRKRIAQHFADRTHKGESIQKQVADISYELTGSELVALLLENQEIKRLSPTINRAQRNRRFNYVIYTYINDRGYRCFDVCRNSAQARKEKEILSEYPSMMGAKGRLKSLRERLELCSAFTHLHPSRSACFHYHLKQCHGACAGKESVEDYNARADLAHEHLNLIFDDDFLLFDRGREPDEEAVVLVEGGHYRGFAFLSKEEGLDANSIRELIKKEPPYPGMARIIQRFMSDNPRCRVEPLPTDPYD